MQGALEAFHTRYNKMDLCLGYVVAAKAEQLVLPLYIGFPAIFKNPKMGIGPVCCLI